MVWCFAGRYERHLRKRMAFTDAWSGLCSVTEAVALAPLSPFGLVIIARPERLRWLQKMLPVVFYLTP